MTVRMVIFFYLFQSFQYSYGHTLTYNQDGENKEVIVESIQTRTVYEVS